MPAIARLLPFALVAAAAAPAYAADPLALHCARLFDARSGKVLGEHTIVAEAVRKEGGLLSAVFEFRPARQLRNANVHARATYSAAAGEFELRRIMDPADMPVREDITDAHVEMP